MKYKINLLKNNLNKKLEDAELIQMFFDFLLTKINLNNKKAFEIVYYLQEELSVFPDNIELCWCCKKLFDTDSEGLYWESKKRFYCGCCCVKVPINYDNNLRK